MNALAEVLACARGRGEYRRTDEPRGSRERDTTEDRSVLRIPDEIAQAFAILGLPTDASTATIRTRYRSLMLQHHPDLVEPAAKEEATWRAAQINLAYDLLVRRAA